MLRLYRHAEWQAFRDAVLELDQRRCRACRRGPDDGVVLQVHHQHYTTGKAPWEYPLRLLCALIWLVCYRRLKGSGARQPQFAIGAMRKSNCSGPTSYR